MVFNALAGASTVPRVHLEAQDMAVRNDVPAGCDVGVVPAPLDVQSPGRAKLSAQVSNTNCCKYPTAGGDWRLTQTEKVETAGVSGSKVMSWRKEVMNLGVSLCEVGNGGVVDPRRLTQGIVVPQHRKLEVPGWAWASVNKMENSLDGLPAHHLYPTESTAGKVGPSTHPGGPSETFSTKGTAATPKPSKALNVGVNVQNDMSAIRGKEPGSNINPLRKSGPTRITRKKPETTNTLWRGSSSANQTGASLTAQVSHPGATFDIDLYNGTPTDLSGRNSGRISGDMAYSFPQPDQQSAGDAHDLSLFYGDAPVVTSKSSKDLASAVLRRHELHLESGVWHYLDAAGHERGPFLLSALQGFVAGGLPAGASVFRKSDNVWVPVSHLIQYFDAHGPASASTLLSHSFEQNCPKKSAVSSGDPANRANIGLKELQLDTPVQSVSSSIFHCEHPQFLGYTNGKLHELVMKSFRGSFAGFFNDALDIWSDSKRSAALPEVVPLDIALGEETDVSTSLQAIADVACPSSVKRSFGLKKVGGKTGNDNRQDVESLRSQMENFADKEIQDVPSPALQSPSIMLNLDQSALDVASPCNVKSFRMRKDKAADYAPLGSGTCN